MATFSATLPVPVTAGETTKKVTFKDTAEAELVRRAQGGDDLAFRQLVEKHQSKVFSIIYGILRSRNDAEDIAQQVFTKIYF